MKSQLVIVLPFEELAPQANARRNARLLDAALASLEELKARFEGLHQVSHKDTLCDRGMFLHN
jgi:hypothetical protein